ncbi:MAG: PEGA domain-containing protein [Polyangiales bacterium]
MIRRLLVVSLCASLVAPMLGGFAHAYPGAPTGPVADESKAEAKLRFDKALTLFQEKDYPGALAEFRRAYELTGNLVVLYNIGLVHDALGQYVQADAALTEVLDAKPDPLNPEWRARATDARTHARARIGTIELVPTLRESKTDGAPALGASSIDEALKGAVIELDGVDVGRWPLAAPLRASIGEHVVGLLANGYAPTRKPVSVAGEASSKVALELLPMTGKAAQIRVVSSVAGGQIVVDGLVVGKTPLATSIAVAPGKHIIELKRAGYSTALTVLELAAGSLGEAKLEPREDPAEVATLGSKALVRVNEPDVLVSIDGAVRDEKTAIAVPPGVHRLHVEKTGFQLYDRDFEVAAGTTANVDVHLVPTPETIAAYDSSIVRHRTWGWIGVVSGALIVGTGGVFYGSYSSGKSSIDERFADHEAQLVKGQPCSRNAGPGVVLRSDLDCEAEADAINRDRTANNRKLYLALGLGAVGLAAIGAGIWSLATTPDSERFAADQKKAQKPPMRVDVQLGGGVTGLILTGAF